MIEGWKLLTNLKKLSLLRLRPPQLVPRNDNKIDELLLFCTLYLRLYALLFFIDLVIEIAGKDFATDGLFDVSMDL